VAKSTRTPPAALIGLGLGGPAVLLIVIFLVVRNCPSDARDVKKQEPAAASGSYEPTPTPSEPTATASDTSDTPKLLPVNAPTPITERAASPQPPRPIAPTIDAIRTDAQAHGLVFGEIINNGRVYHEPTCPATTATMLQLTRADARDQGFLAAWDCHIDALRADAQARGLVFVEITDNGRVFHEPTCPSVTAGMRRVRRNAALADGYTPAWDCYKK
jgi:hypothetical protein